MLATWLASANNLATSIGDYAIRDLYESNARHQITLWGPNGEIIDYANKQWSGIVMDFFIPRWTVFFDVLQDSIITKKKINNNSLKKMIMENAEFPFVRSRNYSKSCEGTVLYEFKV